MWQHSSFWLRDRCHWHPTCDDKEANPSLDQNSIATANFPLPGEYSISSLCTWSLSLESSRSRLNNDQARALPEYKHAAPAVHSIQHSFGVIHVNSRAACIIDKRKICWSDASVPRSWTWGTPARHLRRLDCFVPVVKVVRALLQRVKWNILSRRNLSRKRYSRMSSFANEALRGFLNSFHKSQKSHDFIFKYTEFGGRENVKHY